MDARNAARPGDSDEIKDECQLHAYSAFVATVLVRSGLPIRPKPLIPMDTEWDGRIDGDMMLCFDVLKVEKNAAQDGLRLQRERKIVFRARMNTVPRAGPYGSASLAECTYMAVQL